MNSSKRILVAPLNWGLGHATRCIPIIHELLRHGHQPHIASDGVALSLLKKEFPNIPAFELPSYKISYAEKGKNFKIKMIMCQRVDNKLTKLHLFHVECTCSVRGVWI